MTQKDISPSGLRRSPRTAELLTGSIVGLGNPAGEWVSCGLAVGNSAQRGH